MRPPHFLASVTAVLAGIVLSLPADAATKYRPCSLLTAAELETALGSKVGRSNELDTTIPSGAFKGDIMSTCDWAVGSSHVALNIIRGPKNAQEQAAGRARFRANEELLKRRGWAVEPGNIPGADCVTLKPPASEPTALPVTSCVMVSKGLAFWLGVTSKEPVTAQTVKALADRVAARLP